MLKIILTFLLILALVSCNRDRLNISVEELDAPVAVHRLDLQLADAKSLKEIQSIHDDFGKNHLEFYNFYLGACLQVGLYEDSLTVMALQQFTQDTFIAKLHREIKQEFSDFESYQEQFQQGLAYMHHHFPEAILPQHIILYNSLFSNSVVSSENIIGVGIERYLGAENTSIQDLPDDPFYPYIKRRMDRQFLVRDMMMSWLGTNVLPQINDESELADVMTQWGKHFYALEACFPKMDKHLIMRYFPEEMDWAMENEREFWDYLVAQNSLFKRDYKMALNIFSDGPFTSGLPISETAPPRLGQFLGWRIVKKYMDKNPETTLEQLMKTDFKTILRAYN
jgi:hypothetical protein